MIRTIIAAGLLSFIAFSGPATAASPTPPLSQEGRWITDAKGRTVILHGVNMVYKVGSYAPVDTGFGADDARFLQHHGFNTVRLGVIYKGVEPDPRSGGKPSYDDGYIAKIEHTERTLARRGVFSLIDFHQDLYNEKFQGEGWPDWQVQDDGLPNPENGFPGNYLTNPALNAAFDHFWANDTVGGVKLQDEYAAAWKHVAKFFRGSEHVLGYDVMNEPWPGNQWPTCAQPAGCPQFDAGPLATMFRKATRAIRKVDRRHIVWHEPNVLFDFGAPTNLPSIGSNSGFSFHDYCLTAGSPSCPANEALPFDNADDAAEKTNRALMLSEFGAEDDLEDIGRVVRLAQEHMVSWQYWHYCDCDDPTTSGPGVQSLVIDPSKPPRGDNVKRQKLKVLEQPYPQAVAGTPDHYRYRPEQNTFHLRYSTKTPDGERLPRSVKTILFVPNVHYRDGYELRVSGGDISSHGDTQRVKIRRSRQADEVRVKLEPHTAG